MKDKHKKFYVTTPIYYVTAAPHAGSLYSTLLADVAARWNKIKGCDTFFLTGTDEHGQKVAQAAEAAGMEPQKFVDSFIDAYKDMWYKYDINYTHFIRTTDPSHIKGVQQWVSKLIASGDIYKAIYTGFYCVHCETYVLQREDSTENPPCESCGRKTTSISEESYFFRLSAYQDRLLQFYEENSEFIVPKERLNEVISFVKSGLKDLSISRKTVSWGVPFPGDEHHVVYVWADALLNYLTAIGYMQDTEAETFTHWWPANLQVLGKDIIRFHAVYWPAFLMASNIPCPEKLLVHGWLKVNQQKMSKSLGNAVDPQTLLDSYGVDAVRYYLVRFMAITQDAEFSTQDLEERINADLANDLGNLVQRVLALAKKHELYEISAPKNWGAKEIELRDSFWTMLEQYTIDMDSAYYSRAIAQLWKYISLVNAYFHAVEPWKIKDPERFKEVIAAAVHSLYGTALLLHPVMPKKMDLLLASLGRKLEQEHDYVTELTENPWRHTFMVHQLSEPFFKKHLPAEPVAQDEKPAALSSEMPEISIDEFVKVRQVVGTIEDAQEIEGSDKLLKLTVNFGQYGMRQVVSGIKEHFSPDQIRGVQALFVLNLKPRKIMGLESQAMILTVRDVDNKLKLLQVHTIPNGTLAK